MKRDAEQQAAVAKAALSERLKAAAAAEAKAPPKVLTLAAHVPVMHGPHTPSWEYAIGDITEPDFDPVR